MREIKFQIYWIAGHEMLYDTNNDLEFRDKENYWITDLSDARNHPERYKVRQYTGLKDKNGVEIYEGDILDFWGRKFLVVYNLGGFGCFGLNEVWHPLGDTIYRPTTVIGNRYENPELLK